MPPLISTLWQRKCSELTILKLKFVELDDIHLASLVTSKLSLLEDIISPEDGVEKVTPHCRQLETLSLVNCNQKSDLVSHLPCNPLDLMIPEEFTMSLSSSSSSSSQIPNFHNVEWLSAVAAIMSFSYAFISLGLGVAKLIGNGVIKGTIGGVAAASTTKKLTLVFQALGDIAFAYPYSIIVLEIQDTLKSPPPENQTMKTASSISILITTFFYMCCGCFGYAKSNHGGTLTG
ncbi:hypothetical protein Droror1_Dr00015046 [Drosera rotundifolia]